METITKFYNDIGWSPHVFASDKIYKKNGAQRFPHTQEEEEEHILNVVGVNLHHTKREPLVPTVWRVSATIFFYYKRVPIAISLTFFFTR
jgi:hypothetical protein